MWRENEIVDNTYQIMGKLGAGGTGEIYLAYHIRLEKYVVLKRIKDAYCDVIKVKTEVEILKELHHTYLPQVYDFVQNEKGIYTVIDYIDGYDIDKYISTGAVFSQEQLMLWLTQLCEVLKYIHTRSRQVLHCDIKPGNIIITADGNVCLIDFNISLDGSENDKLAGISPYYASPEQYNMAMMLVNRQQPGYKLDPRTDIYSLGATFYHMISGVCPSVAGNNVPLADMGLPFDVEFLKIIDRMMMRDPDNRYSSAADILTDLNRLRGQDKALRKTVFGMVATTVVYAVVLMCGIWMCVSGATKKEIKLFNDEKAAFLRDVKNGAYETSIEEGVKLLNGYSDLLADNRTAKAEILHAVGESYYYCDDYPNAERFYKEALDNGAASGNRATYYRDYIITLILNSKTSLAQKTFEEAKRNGLKDLDLQFVEAQMSFSEKSFADAETKCKNIIQSGKDRDLTARAYRLMSYIYAEKGDLKARASCLRELVQADPSFQSKRLLANALIECGTNSLVPNEKKNYYSEACVYYGQIYSSSFALFRDKLNYTVALMELGDNEAAQRILGEMGNEYPNDFRVDMYKASIYLGEGDTDRARSCCQDAVRKYRNSNAKDTADRAETEELRNIAERCDVTF